MRTAMTTIRQQVNRILCGNIAEGRFISFVYCTLDTSLGILTYANAGHFPPILVHADGSIDRLATGGPVLGPFSDATYDERSVTIASGDRLVLFTDGMTEVRPANTSADDPGHIEFGEDALSACAIEHRSCSAPALQARLSAAVSTYAGGVFQDDATLMIVAID